MNLKIVLKRSQKSRALRITIRPDGSVFVTAPAGATSTSINRFLEKHHDWIKRTVVARKGTPVIYARRADIPALKRQALLLAKERCTRMAKLYGVTFEKITIRAQRARWGSCSRNGNLSFNYRIALLPSHLADYVFIHEVCHRIVFNHSAAFWKCVGIHCPDYKKMRQELNKTVFVFS